MGCFGTLLSLSALIFIVVIFPNFFAFLSALFFMVVSLPIWVFITALWMCLVGVFYFFMMLIVFAISIFENNNLNFPDDILPIFFSIIMIPLRAIYEGVTYGLEIPSWLWDFARFDHPLIAFILSCIIISCYVKASN